MNNQIDEDEHQSVGQRLKAARLLIGLSQLQVAEKAGVSQVSIQHLETGRNQNSRHLVSIATAIGVRPEWLMTGKHPMLSGPISVPRSPSEKDYALIPQYKARGACGDGYLNDHVEVTEGLVFKKDWLTKMKVKPENLHVIYAEGDSMEPYVFDGDVVLFDASQVEPRDRQAYVIRRPDGGISIKRLTQQLTGGWLIRSDNSDKAKYPDELVSPEALHEIPVLGKVIWRGGAM